MENTNINAEVIENVAEEGIEVAEAAVEAVKTYSDGLKKGFFVGALIVPAGYGIYRLGKKVIAKIKEKKATESEGETVEVTAEDVK